MTKNMRIAPSILSANFACLAADIARVEACADLLHLDVMDGHFVPNITFGPPLVKCIRENTKLFLDVHLMISDPDQYAEPFIKAGADNLTFHIEVAKDPAGLVKKIRELGAGASVSLNPDTPADSLEPVIDLVDMVLVMTVMPGFGGQAFRADQLPKIEKILRRRPGVRIEVDGGINEETIPLTVRAGADTFVAGTAVFKASDPAQAVIKLREIANAAKK
ncbi:MAG: ribulose-phosphate 3-epimerase [Phycisphaerae bacterium]